MNEKRTENLEEMKKFIVKLRNEGKSFREIEKIANCYYGTIKRIIAKYKDIKSIKNFPRFDHPKKSNKTNN